MYKGCFPVAQELLCDSPLRILQAELPTVSPNFHLIIMLYDYRLEPYNTDITGAFTVFTHRDKISKRAEMLATEYYWKRMLHCFHFKMRPLWWKNATASYESNLWHNVR